MISTFKHVYYFLARLNLTYFLSIQVCGASESEKLPPNFVKLAKDAYTPDLMAASDCMLG